IFARKILMGTVGDNMDEIDSAVASGDIDLQHLAGHADGISVALLVFPHLFPPASNEWKEGATRDPGADTFASPEVWTRFADFYKMASEASKLAYDASRARSKDDFKKAGIALRQACDACHVTFMKKDRTATARCSAWPARSAPSALRRRPPPSAAPPRPRAAPPRHAPLVFA